ncbi:MAG: CDP-archaeol synthase [Desulforhabdus sp.]|jgi:predicted MPP superfamily phosphohydrolase|nr:CDP-archaeol synthase [Desulforhabdus sp.]
MLLCLKILFLLWLINFAPPLLAHLLGQKWDNPVDAGRLFKDGKPLFGPHKTKRGVLAGVATGLMVGWLFGFPAWVGFSAGLLSMSGDVLSSFIKRRLDLPAGSAVFGLDQVFEGSFPFIVLAPYGSLKPLNVIILTVLFIVVAYSGSRFFKEVLLSKPYEHYPRKLNSWVRFREFRACQITSHPLHHFVNFEDAFYYHFVMKWCFRALGLYRRGMRNALQIEVTHINFDFEELPPAFDGYRILFLTDLHLDGLEGLTEKLQTLVGNIQADLCVIGGDLRMETHGPFSRALSLMRRLIPAIHAKDGIFGILGNHDCLEIIEVLQKEKITFLVNDAMAVERQGERIWFVGVDDPHYYRCEDLEQAFRGVGEEDFAVFLAHSNEVYREARRYGPKLYLCGHSHAGQIQLPPFGPLFTHSRAPRRYSQGKWHYQGMLGYTSCGAGVSGVPLRFFSHGEVALITLNRKSSGRKKRAADAVL